MASSEHEALKRRRQAERRAIIRKQVEKVGNKPGKYPGRAGTTKSSAVHAEGGDANWKAGKRADLHRERLVKSDRAKTKAAPRGPTKAAKNIAKAGKLARGANMAGMAAAYGGLVADTMNPSDEMGVERQRRLAELMRRNEAY